MLFDIGWPELMLIGVVALVVIGPKDLPRALRIAGYWVRKARTLSREFQSSIDQMIREAELDEMRQELKKATEFDINKEFQNTVDPTGELAESIKPPEIPDFFEPAPSAAGERPASEEHQAAALPPPDQASSPEKPVAAAPDDEPLLPLELPSNTPEAAHESVPPKP
jgi:sec-independent protein translocase protein TatB